MWNIGKAATAGAWIWAIAGAVAPDAVPGGEYGLKVAGFLAVAHVAELPIYWSTLKRAPGPLGGHVAQTLVFGVFHWLSVRDQAATAKA